MKTLKLGVTNNTELAEWFGVKEKTFRTNKTAKLKELELFCNFNILAAGKIEITEIFNDTYSKQGSKTYQMIRDNIDNHWDKTGLDSCSRVVSEILADLDDKIKVEDSTAYKYTCKGRNELYGRPFKNMGKLGRCEYLWAKRTKDGHYALLTSEENTIKEKLIKKYFGDATEKQIMVAEMVKNKEISESEAWSVLENLTHMERDFMVFLTELQKELNSQIVRATLVTRNTPYEE